METYCLATGMVKCDSCQHRANWLKLNELDDKERLARQAKMKRIDSAECDDLAAKYYLQAK